MNSLDSTREVQIAYNQGCRVHNEKPFPGAGKMMPCPEEGILKVMPYPAACLQMEKYIGTPWW